VKVARLATTSIVLGVAFSGYTTVWSWVLRYAPELNKRIRREVKPTNGSWRTDETYVRVAGHWTHLYVAVDSTGSTIDFLLSEWSSRFHSSK